jgi:hypothetical protein
MSKASRSRNREKRTQQKRARRAANQAQYQAWARAGENTKSFRARKRSKKTKYNMNKGVHTHYCGNLSCTQCFEHVDGVIITKRNKNAA